MAGNAGIAVIGSNKHNSLIDRDVAGNHSKLIPDIDSTEAIQIMKADGITPVATVDTVNSIFRVHEDLNVGKDIYINNAPIKSTITLSLIKPEPYKLTSIEGLKVNGGSRGAFVDLNTGDKSWTGITSIGNDLYATVANGSIWKSENGGAFVDLNTGDKSWYGITSIGSDLYACVYNGSIWKSENGGAFVDLNADVKDWRGITSIGNDLYACVNDGSIWKSENGGAFVDLNTGNKLWNGITSIGNDLYACYFAGSIYKSTYDSDVKLDGNLTIDGDIKTSKNIIFPLATTSIGSILWGDNPTSSDNAGRIFSVSMALYICGGRGTYATSTKGIKFRPVSDTDRGTWNNTGLRIGDSNDPTEMLDIVGNIKASGDISIGGNVNVLGGIKDSGLTLSLDSTADGTSNNTIDLFYNTGATTGYYALFMRDKDQVVQHALGSSNRDSYLCGIDGNLSIGKKTADERLDVNGNIKASGNVIIGSNKSLLIGTNPTASDYEGAINAYVGDYLYIDGGRGAVNGVGAKGLRFRPINGSTLGIWNNTGLRIGDGNLPSATLDVAGSVKSSGNLTVTGYILSSSQIKSSQIGTTADIWNDAGIMVQGTTLPANNTGMTSLVLSTSTGTYGYSVSALRGASAIEATFSVRFHNGENIGTEVFSINQAGDASVSGNLTVTNLYGNLNGYALSTSSANSTVALRNSNGDLYTRYLQSVYVNMSHNVGTRTSDTIFYSSTDNYIRKTNALGLKNSIGIGDFNVKVINGYMPTTTGNYVAVSHGLIASKIIGFTYRIVYDTDHGIQYRSIGGYESIIWHNSSHFYLQAINNSTSLAGDYFHIIIFYKE